MKDIKPQDIWWVDFPYDDIENSKIRPVIVLKVYKSILICENIINFLLKYKIPLAKLEFLC